MLNNGDGWYLGPEDWSLTDNVKINKEKFDTNKNY